MDDKNEIIQNLNETENEDNEAIARAVNMDINDIDQFNNDELNKNKKMRVFLVSKLEDLKVSSCSLNLESPSPKEKVFGNPLLLIKIFESCTKTDLLQCRLVNMKLWNELATEILVRKRMCRINFEYDSYIRKFTLAYTESVRLNYFPEDNDNINTFEPRPTLSSLTKCIRKSKNFPCVKFGFWDGFICNKDKSKDFRSFIILFGHQIRELEVDLYCRDNATLTPLRRLLLTQTTNIDLLHIQNFDGWNDHSTTSFLGPVANPKFQLPNLKYLLFGQGVEWNSNVIQHIREAAPNIQAFRSISSNFAIDDLSTYAQFNKMDTIRHLILEEDQLEAQEEFAEMKHPLSSISFLFNSNFYGETLERQFRFSAAWVKILETSSSKLTKISLLDRVGYVPGFGPNFPPLPLVKKIRLSLNEQLFGAEDDVLYSLRVGDTRAWSVIPFGSQFSSAFPNLNHVVLKWSNMYWNVAHIINEWDRFFPPQLNPAPSVTRLDLPNLCPLDWLSKLAEFFPSVQSLKLGLNMNFPSVAHAIWTHFNKLTALDLSICVSDKAHPENTRIKLDAAFCGFSEQTCQELKEQEDNGTITTADLLTTNSSIRDLKSLKKLRIEFRDHGSNNTRPWDYLSNVTLAFALKEMCEEGELKDFTVKIIVDHPKRVKKDLQNLAKYARIEVEKLDRMFHFTQYGC